MKVDINFREFFQSRYDIFGFEKEVATAQQPKKFDELPINNFNLQYAQERLGKNDLPGAGKPHSRFITEMQWGTQPGAVRVVWTPKLNVKIQRLAADREGNPVWLMKKFFFIKDDEYGGREDIVADEVFEQVRMVAEQPLDHPPQDKYKLEDVAYSLAAKLRQQNYDIIQYEGIKKLNENEYDIFFWLRGGGTGTLTGLNRGQRPGLALIVKVGYNENTGCIHAFAQMIQGSDDTASWEIQPAEFEEYYMPTQPKHEILESIVTSLKWF